jgi:SAM-dependent methyltransferase
LDDARLTGLDIDGPALAENPRVDERIVGSVETYPLPAEEFDVVVCWDVLEHLSQPDLALANLAQTLKPGGTMILGFPNPLSVKGLLTKLTPYSFHRWVYRQLLGSTLEPYPTVLRLSLRPSAMRRWAVAQGFDLQVRVENGRVPAPRRGAGRWAKRKVFELVWWRSECRVQASKPVVHASV